MSFAEETSDIPTVSPSVGSGGSEDSSTGGRLPLSAFTATPVLKLTKEKVRVRTDSSAKPSSVATPSEQVTTPVEAVIKSPPEPAETVELSTPDEGEERPSLGAELLLETVERPTKSRVSLAEYKRRRSTIDEAGTRSDSSQKPAQEESRPEPESSKQSLPPSPVRTPEELPVSDITASLSDTSATLSDTSATLSDTSMAALDTSTTVRDDTSTTVCDPSLDTNADDTSTTKSSTNVCGTTDSSTNVCGTTNSSTNVCDSSVDNSSSIPPTTVPSVTTSSTRSTDIPPHTTLPVATPTPLTRAKSASETVKATPSSERPVSMETTQTEVTKPVAVKMESPLVKAHTAADRGIVGAEKTPGKADRGIVGAEKTPGKADRGIVGAEKTPGKADRGIVESEKTPGKADKGLTGAEKTSGKVDRGIVESEKTPGKADRGNTGVVRTQGKADVQKPSSVDVTDLASIAETAVESGKADVKKPAAQDTLKKSVEAMPKVDIKKEPTSHTPSPTPHTPSSVSHASSPTAHTPSPSKPPSELSGLRSQTPPVYSLSGTPPLPPDRPPILPLRPPMSDHAPPIRPPLIPPHPFQQPWFPDTRMMSSAPFFRPPPMDATRPTVPPHIGGFFPPDVFPAGFNPQYHNVEDMLRLPRRSRRRSRSWSSSRSRSHSRSRSTSRSRSEQSPSDSNSKETTSELFMKKFITQVMQNIHESSKQVTEQCTQTSVRTSSRRLQAGPGFKFKNVRTQTPRPPRTHSQSVQCVPRTSSRRVQTDTPILQHNYTQTHIRTKEVACQTKRMHTPREAVSNFLKNMASLFDPGEHHECSEFAEIGLEGYRDLSALLGVESGEGSDYDTASMSLGSEGEESDDEDQPSPVVSGASNISEGDLPDVESPGSVVRSKEGVVIPGLGGGASHSSPTFPSREPIPFLEHLHQPPMPSSPFPAPPPLPLGHTHSESETDILDSMESSPTDSQQSSRRSTPCRDESPHSSRSTPRSSPEPPGAMGGHTGSGRGHQRSQSNSTSQTSNSGKNSNNNCRDSSERRRSKVSHSSGGDYEEEISCHGNSPKDTEIPVEGDSRDGNTSLSLGGGDWSASYVADEIPNHVTTPVSCVTAPLSHVTTPVSRESSPDSHVSASVSQVTSPESHTTTPVHLLHKGRAKSVPVEVWGCADEPPPSSSVNSSGVGSPDSDSPYVPPISIRFRSKSTDVCPSPPAPTRKKPLLTAAQLLAKDRAKRASIKERGMAMREMDPHTGSINMTELMMNFYHHMTTVKAKAHHHGYYPYTSPVAAPFWMMPTPTQHERQSSTLEGAMDEDPSFAQVLADYYSGVQIDQSCDSTTPLPVTPPTEFTDDLYDPISPTELSPGGERVLTPDSSPEVLRGAGERQVPVNDSPVCSPLPLTPHRDSAPLRLSSDQLVQQPFLSTLACTLTSEAYKESNNHLVGINTTHTLDENTSTEENFTPSLEKNTAHSLEENTTHTLKENITPSREENTTDSHTTHTVEENTTHTVEESSTHAVEKNTTHAVEENTTHAIEKNTTHAVENTTHTVENHTHTVEDNTTHTVEENTTHTVEESSTHAVEKNTTHTVEENTTHTLEENTTHTIEENAAHTVEENTKEQLSMSSDQESPKQPSSTEPVTADCSSKATLPAIAEYYVDFLDKEFECSRRQSSVCELLLDESDPSTPPDSDGDSEGSFESDISSPSEHEQLWLPTGSKRSRSVSECSFESDVFSPPENVQTPLPSDSMLTSSKHLVKSDVLSQSEQVQTKSPSTSPPVKRRSQRLRTVSTRYKDSWLMSKLSNYSKRNSKSQHGDRSGNIKNRSGDAGSKSCDARNRSGDAGSRQSGTRMKNARRHRPKADKLSVTSQSKTDSDPLTISDLLTTTGPPTKSNPLASDPSSSTTPQVKPLPTTQNGKTCQSILLSPPRSRRNTRVTRHNPHTSTPDTGKAGNSKVQNQVSPMLYLVISGMLDEKSKKVELRVSPTPQRGVSGEDAPHSSCQSGEEPVHSKSLDSTNKQSTRQSQVNFDCALA